MQEETDTKEMPPCILLKSDGATLYATTDLATIVQREQDFHPGKILYLTDKRQSLHFEQVFRVARKAALVPPTTELAHIGFGTMNGKDGKPFKTREGGVMRLEVLIREITDYVTDKIKENQTVSDEELPETAKKIAMAALKYGDLSNLATKDYVFDLGPVLLLRGKHGPLHFIHHRSHQVDSVQIQRQRGGLQAPPARKPPAEGPHARPLPPCRQLIFELQKLCAERDLRIYATSSRARPISSTTT